MSTKNFLPTNDDKFAAWLQNFNAVATSNKGLLGLTDADIAADNINLANVNEGITIFNAAKASAKATVKAKAANRRAAAAAVRAQNKRIQLQPGVTDALLTQLGLPVHQKPGTPGSVTPVTPVALSATPSATGANALKWKPAGNKPGTIYQVYAMTPAPGVKVVVKDGQPQVADTAWTHITGVNAARFVHTGCVPGQKMFYRIIAQRGPKLSDPSAAAIVYGP